MSSGSDYEELRGRVRAYVEARVGHHFLSIESVEKWENLLTVRGKDTHGGISTFTLDFPIDEVWSAEHLIPRRLIVNRAVVHTSRISNEIADSALRCTSLYEGAPQNILFTLSWFVQPARREAVLGDAEAQHLANVIRFGVHRATQLLCWDVVCTAVFWGWTIIETPLLRVLGALRGVAGGR